MQKEKGFFKRRKMVNEPTMETVYSPYLRADVVKEKGKDLVYDFCVLLMDNSEIVDVFGWKSSTKYQPEENFPLGNSLYKIQSRAIFKGTVILTVKIAERKDNE